MKLAFITAMIVVNYQPAWTLSIESKGIQRLFTPDPKSEQLISLPRESLWKCKIGKQQGAEKLPEIKARKLSCTRSINGDMMSSTLICDPSLPQSATNFTLFDGRKRQDFRFLFSCNPQGDSGQQTTNQKEN